MPLFKFRIPVKSCNVNKISNSNEKIRKIVLRRIPLPEFFYHLSVPYKCRTLRNLLMSMKKMACDFKVNHETMHKLVSEDLGMRNFKRNKVHYLNDSIRAKRMKWCKGVLSVSVLEIWAAYSSQMGEYLLLKKQQTSNTTRLCQRTSRTFQKVLK